MNAHDLISDKNETYRFLMPGAVDAAVMAGSPDGTGSPSAGWTAVVKDDISVAGFPCTAGSASLAGWFPASDAPAVASLRRSGVRILGKSNLSEWAGGRALHQIRGWSQLGGQCRNSQDPALTPGGSSAGSAVAVALGVADVALGTETLGSVVSPASMNGVAGLKPTFGAISPEGIIPTPGPLGQNTIGLITSSVRSISQFFSMVMTDEFRRDVARRREEQELTSPSEKTRVVYWPGLADGREPGLAALGDVLRSVLEEHSIVTADVDLALAEPMQLLMRDLLSFEFGRSFDEFLRGLPDGHPHSLQELVEFNRTHTVGIEGYDCQNWFEERIDRSRSPYADAELHRADRARLTASAQTSLRQALDTNDSVAIVTLTERPPWILDPTQPEPDIPMAQVLPCVGGNPHVTIPGLRIDGRPVGVSLIGRPLSDFQLLELGTRLEAALRDRQ